MWSRDKDGLSTDAVHVNAGACLQVIQMDVAIFGNKENHIVLGAYLSKINIYTHIMTVFLIRLRIQTNLINQI